MLKRIIRILLVMILVISAVPVPAYAEESVSVNPQLLEPGWPDEWNNLRISEDEPNDSFVAESAIYSPNWIGHGDTVLATIGSGYYPEKDIWDEFEFYVSEPSTVEIVALTKYSDQTMIAGTTIQYSHFEMELKQKGEDGITYTTVGSDSTGEYFYYSSSYKYYYSICVNVQPGTYRLYINDLCTGTNNYKFHLTVTECAHSYKPEITPPTCIAEGYTTYTCRQCGKTYKDNYTSSIGHRGVAVKGKSATCTESGLTDGVTCTVCGYAVKKQEVLPALGHSYGDWTTTTEATCTEAGRRSRTCSRCGYVQNQTDPSLGHSYSDWETTSEKTCTENGSRKKTCSRCSDELTEVLYAPGHHLIKDPAIAPTCLPGLTEGEHCDRCGEVTKEQQQLSPVKDHTYVGSVCSSCGLDIGPITGSIRWDYDENVRTLTISGTGAMVDYKSSAEVPWANLRPNISKITVEDGITHIGAYAFSACNNLVSSVTFPDSVVSIGKYAFYNCSRMAFITLPAGLTRLEERTLGSCSRLWELTIPKTVTYVGSHQFEQNTSLQKITFQGDAPEFADDAFADYSGTVYYPDGNKTWTETIKQKFGGNITWKPKMANGHVPRVIGAVKPTCTTSGQEEGLQCEECGEILRYPRFLPALQHLYGQTMETKPTCTEEGKMWTTCIRCSQEQSVVTPALGHKYQSVVTNPTCSDAGYTTHTCSACGNSCQDTPLPAKGHSYGEWQETKASTCTETGSQRRDCTVCDHYETGTVAAAGHSLKNYYVVVKEATCTEGGEYRQYCKNCDHYDTKVIGARNHDYSRTEVTVPTCTEGGYTTHICIYCSDSYTDTETAPAGHSMGDWVDDQAATCTAEGTQRSDCINCDHFETRKTEEIPHSYEAVTTPPTCTTVGYTTHTCSVCGHSYTDSETPVVDHSYGDWVTTKESTCTDTGTRECSCSVCGNTKSEIIPASHNIVDGVCRNCGQSTGSCGKNAYWAFDAQTGILTISGSGAMTDYAAAADLPWYSLRDGVQTVIVSDGITHIADRAFVAHKSLIRAELPDTLQSIGESAFYNCAALPEIVIPDNVRSLGTDVFYLCGALTEIVIPEGVTEIPESAFYKCAKLVSISIPESVTHIGNWAFMYCGHLEEVTIPSGITSIGYSTFNSCSRLKEIRIPEGVTTIDNYAFQNCLALKNVHLPETLESIGLSAFQNCTALTSVRIPASVTTIKGSAFSGCSSLVKVAFAGSAPEIASTAFNSVTADAYYPGSDTSWKYEKGNYGGTLSWKAHCTSHTLVTDPGVAATCTAPGLTEGKHCSVCLFVQKAQQATPVAGHSYGSWKTVTAATCQTEGVQQRTCGACGATQTQKVAASGHTYRSVVVKPTCTASGYTIHTCSVCGDSYQDQPVPVLNHQANTSWHSDSDSHWQSCRFCNTEMNRAAHHPGEPATEKTSQKCSVCGHVFQHPKGLNWFLDNLNEPNSYLWTSDYYTQFMEQYG